MLIALVLRSIHFLVPHYPLSFIALVLILFHCGVAANAAGSPSASTAVVCYVLGESSSCILKYGRTVSITPTDTTAASTLSGSSIQSSGRTVDFQLAEMKAAMQKMAETVSSQATSVAALTRHIANNGGGGGGRTGGVGGHTTVKNDKKE